MKIGTKEIKSYPTKQVKVEKLFKGQLADTGGEVSDRMMNQYAKDPPENENDFMSAFMGKGRFS